jgi:hypothetical protein
MHGGMTVSGATSETVYVELLDKAVPVWRPVAAVAEAEGVYRLSDAKPSDTTEVWAFAPGSRVLCERRLLDGGEQLVATSLA